MNVGRSIPGALRETFFATDQHEKTRKDMQRLRGDWKTDSPRFLESS
jgi:hypothetical protein